MWQPTDLSFLLLDDGTDHPVVTVVVSTPDGTLKFMAEPELIGRTLFLHGVHMQDASPNAVGVANLMVLAHAVIEGMDLDGLVVEGAFRTTGANPGRRPDVLRFTRRLRPPAASDPAP